jgi:hypothetical protein
MISQDRTIGLFLVFFRMFMCASVCMYEVLSPWLFVRDHVK